MISLMNINSNKITYKGISNKKHQGLNKEPIQKNELGMSKTAAECFRAIAFSGLVYDKRFDTAPKMPETIDFQKGNNLQEAYNFGKEVLGIKEYEGFEESDIDVVNYINEGIVYVNNATKGRGIMPTKIIYGELKDGNKEVVGVGMNSLGEMTISKAFINDRKNTVISVLNLLWEDNNKVEPFIKKQDERKNFTSYMNIFMYILNYYQDIMQDFFQEGYLSTFSIISHEMGHLQHCFNTRNNLYALGKENEKIFEESKDIANNISNYAKKSPTEFVAECFAQMVDNIELDEDVMKLYRKLGGFEV